MVVQGDRALVGAWGDQDPDARGGTLAELAAPTADTDVRGRGLLVEIVDDGRVDYLTVSG